jgi:FkbM family methyltransferase
MSSKGRIKRLADSILSPLDLTLARRHEVDRTTLPGVLDQLERCGFEPATVIDVGAAYGLWSAACHERFPRARFILIEPVEEYAPFLENRAAPWGGTYIQAAAASTIGTRQINVHDDLVGTSFFSEAEGPGVDGTPRSVPTIQLDETCRELGATAPILMKLDVQGSELDVLEGATEILELTEVIIMEVSFFGFFREAPTVVDVITSMAEKDFVPYDILDLHHRPLDGALAQADFVFTRHDSGLRKFHSYATPQQRTEQVRSARAARARHLRRSRRTS